MVDNNVTELANMIVTSYGTRILVRDNLLIKAIYSATALETKILLQALYDAQQTRELEFRYTTQQMAEYLEVPLGPHIYSILHDAVEHMLGNKVIIYDNKKNLTKGFVIVPSCSFEKGIFSIALNKDFLPYLINIKPPYTTMDLNNLRNLGNKRSSKNFSIRLYELLKTKAYLLEKDDPVPVVTEYFPLEEVKIRTGLVCAANDDLSRIIDACGMTDTALELAGELYPSWRDFRRRVLEPAIRDINEQTDMHISYEARGAGSSGKIIGLTFYVKKNTLAEDSGHAGGERPQPADKAADVSAVREILGDGLCDRAVRSILSAAGGDVGKVRGAYELASAQMQSGRVIRDLEAWLTRAVTEGWNGACRRAGAALPHARGHSDRYGFEANEYDFEKLEEELLSSSAG